MKYITTTLALLFSLTSVAQCDVYTIISSKDADVDQISVYRISDLTTESRKYWDRFTEFKTTCFSNEVFLPSEAQATYEGSSADHVFVDYGVYAVVAYENGSPTGGVSYLLVDRPLYKEFGSDYAVDLSIQDGLPSYTMQD